jgi:hypothetical protein
MDGTHSWWASLMLAGYRPDKIHDLDWEKYIGKPDETRKARQGQSQGQQHSP